MMFSTILVHCKYARNARGKYGGQGSWLFWLFVITNIAATMRMATIILAFPDGNILIGHESIHPCRDNTISVSWQYS